MRGVLNNRTSVDDRNSGIVKSTDFQSICTGAFVSCLKASTVCRRFRSVQIFDGIVVTEPRELYLAEQPLVRCWVACSCPNA